MAKEGDIYLESMLVKYSDEDLISELRRRGFVVLDQQNSNDVDIIFTKSELSSLQDLLDSMNIPIGSILYDLREKLICK